MFYFLLPNSFRACLKAEYYGVCKEDGDMAQMISLPADQTTYTLKQLKAGTSYKVRMRAWVMRDGVKQGITLSLKSHYVTKGSAVYTNVKSLTLKTKKLELAPKEKQKISAKVTLQDPKKTALDHTALLRYVSSDTSIATVAADGTVKGVKTGSCKIYVITPGGLYKTVKVTVGIPAEKISFGKKSYTVKAGEKLNLLEKLKVKPANAAISLTWKSSGKKIATVDENGIVTGLKKGTVTITVKDVSGLKITVTVKVK